MSHEHDTEKATVRTVAPTINPGPLGLSAFALTTFVLSLSNLGVGMPSGGSTGIVTGLAFFYGGMVQILAGMWEFHVGNNFGATAFSSYGAFWLSYAAIITPAFNSLAGYATAPPETIDNALGIFLIAWAFFTFMLWIGTLRSTVALSSIFFTLTLTFVFLASGHLAHLEANNVPTKIGGGLGLVTAFLAWYNAAAGLYTPANTFVRLPVGPLSHPRSE